MPSEPARAIFDALRDEIVSGRLAPDTPLGQEDLAERFGVSRMPVREAIWQLEALGFVTVEPNRRARVRLTMPRRSGETRSASSVAHLPQRDDPPIAGPEQRTQTRFARLLA